MHRAARTELLQAWARESCLYKTCSPWLTQLHQQGRNESVQARTPPTPNSFWVESPCFLLKHLPTAGQLHREKELSSSSFPLRTETDKLHDGQGSPRCTHSMTPASGTLRSTWKVPTHGQYGRCGASTL